VITSAALDQDGGGVPKAATSRFLTYSRHVAHHCLKAVQQLGKRGRRLLELIDLISLSHRSRTTRARSGKDTTR